MHEIDQMLKYQLEGKHVEARELSDKLEQIGEKKILDPQGNNTQDIWLRHCFNRGWFMIQDGDYQKGCQLLEHGRYLNTYGSPPLKTDAPIFNPQMHTIKGKSIIISLEGGYGDEIIHARFAQTYKELGASKVYLAAAPEVVSIFQRIPGVDGVILRNQAHLVQHDYWVPGFSAGWVAGLEFDTFPSKPYLSPIPQSVDIWKSLIKAEEGKIKVGIRWAGNPKFEHQQFRKFPEEFITNLSKYKELEIFSLQRDHNVIALPEGVHDLQYLLLSWEDTMAAIANLDIVITSCTSIAHLSAAMGKETWVMVPILPYHTWTHKSPDSNTSPYYECVQLFRQHESRKWNDTFQNMYKALEEKFNLEHVEMPNEDRVTKKLNMGSGLFKMPNFVNVDKSELTNPDEVVDLEVTPWPWKSNEYDHIVAKDVLDHLGETPEDFINIIKEMYRVSENGAIWEIQIPHWRSDTAISDPTKRRALTVDTFLKFNQKYVHDSIQKGNIEPIFTLEEGIDLEVCDSKFEFTKPWKEQIKTGKVKDEELRYALNHFNNVAESVQILVQVHKPGRFSLTEVKSMLSYREQ